MPVQPFKPSVVREKEQQLGKKATHTRFVLLGVRSEDVTDKMIVARAKYEFDDSPINIILIIPTETYYRRIVGSLQPVSIVLVWYVRTDD